MARGSAGGEGGGVFLAQKGTKRRHRPGPLWGLENWGKMSKKKKGNQIPAICKGNYTKIKINTFKQFVTKKGILHRKVCHKCVLYERLLQDMMV